MQKKIIENIKIIKNKIHYIMALNNIDAIQKLNCYGSLKSIIL